MGFWPIVGTVISTWCGASVFIGTVGLGFTVGASGYVRFSFASVLFTLILILIFSRTLRRQKIHDHRVAALADPGPLRARRAAKARPLGDF